MAKESKRKVENEDIVKGENMAHIKVHVSRPFGEKNPDIRIFVDKVEIQPYSHAGESADAREAPYEIHYKPAHPEDEEQVEEVLRGLQIHLLPGELRVERKLSVSCPTTSPVVAGTIFTAPLKASGGYGNYTYAVSGDYDWITSPDNQSIKVAPLANTASGVYSYNIEVTDLGGKGESATCTCSVYVPSQPTCCCPAIVAVAGSQVKSPPLTGSASGGVGQPYTFMASGLQAYNLSMDPTGVITGTVPIQLPQGQNNFPYTGNFAITVSDGATPTNQGTVTCATITVLPPLAVSCPTISVVSGWASPSYAVVPSGGEGNYTLSSPANSCVSLSNGMVSISAPGPSGSYPATYPINVADGAGNTATATGSIMVLPAVAVTLPANPVVNNTYKGILDVTGGTGGPYVFLQPGAGSTLPAGLNLTSDGHIYGKPTTAGSVDCTLIVKDANCNSGSVTFSIKVLEAPSATWPLLNAVEGEPVNVSVQTVRGGVGSVTGWNYVASGLPRGLHMDSNSGTVLGTATVSGKFSFTGTIKDANGNVGTGSGSVTVLSVQQSEIERAKKEFDATINTYQNETSIGSHEKIMHDLLAIKHSVSKYTEELEHSDSDDHGFRFSFPPDVLLQGERAEVSIFKQNHPKPIVTLPVDSKTGSVSWDKAIPGEVYEVEALLNGFAIQKITVTAR
jgi:hypothetical protein